MPVIQAPPMLHLGIAALAGYFLGALPFAYVVGKLNGVNIFKIGSGQAGATNIFRHIGPRAAAIVFFSDIAKGALAILFAMWLGISGPWLLVPALATTMGHWNSVFTWFKGGDGVVTGVGIAMVLAPFAVAIPFAVGAFVLWRWHGTAHPTLWGGIAGYAAFLAVAQADWANVDTGVLLGITVLCAAILLHSLVYHRRHPRPATAGQRRDPSEDEESQYLEEQRQR
ncbi:MAG: glycerol-3-phosphate acyltransferase [Chloroflexi bacterium]|nr:glycerol-3-phosphate acyltransferase [Chloroflexota bacterium]